MCNPDLEKPYVEAGERQHHFEQDLEKVTDDFWDAITLGDAIDGLADDHLSDPCELLADIMQMVAIARDGCARAWQENGLRLKDEAAEAKRLQIRKLLALNLEDAIEKAFKAHLETQAEKLEG